MTDNPLDVVKFWFPEMPKAQMLNGDEPVIELPYTVQTFSSKQGQDISGGLYNYYKYLSGMRALSDVLSLTSDGLGKKTEPKPPIVIYSFPEYHDGPMEAMKNLVLAGVNILKGIMRFMIGSNG